MSTLTEIFSHPFFYKLGWTLLHLLWQGAVVAVMLAVLLRLLRKSSANLRYVVACSVLAFIIVGFVATFCLISAPPDSGGIESAPVGPLADSLLARRTGDMPLARAAEYMEIFTRTSWTQRVEEFFAPALPYIVAAWLFGVVALSLYHLGGWTHLQRLRRSFTKQADASLLAKLGALVEKLRITRPVRLLESALVQPSSMKPRAWPKSPLTAKSSSCPPIFPRSNRNREKRPRKVSTYASEKTTPKHSKGWRNRTKMLRYLHLPN